MSRQHYTILFFALTAGMALLAFFGYTFFSASQPEVTCGASPIKETELLWESVARGFIRSLVSR